MILLALDPGVTTGWAVLGESGVYDTGNFLAEDLREGLIYVMEHWAPQEAVVEVFPLAPSGALATQLREVVATINLVLTDYARLWHPVTPGVWKTSSAPESPKTRYGVKLTPHERDAIRMGRYWLGSRHV